MFVGSGLPRGLWRRLTERFAPARVLEMWGSAERGAVLVNGDGRKVGCVGQPFPGAAAVRLGRFDLVAGDVVRDADGFVVPAARGELGLMFTQDRAAPFKETSTNDVFRRGDSWQATSSLFRRDSDGDFWLEGMIHEVVRTSGAAVLPGPVAAVFEELPQVSSAVAYARPGKRGAQVLCVALSAHHDLGPAAVTSAAWRLEEGARPTIVHLLPSMIFSSSGRPAGTAVAREQIDLDHPAWVWDTGRAEYRRLTKTALARLLAP
jgi:putative long chain acyl-CoA synthase